MKKLLVFFSLICFTVSLFLVRVEASYQIFRRDTSIVNQRTYGFVPRSNESPEDVEEVEDVKDGEDEGNKEDKNKVEEINNESNLNIINRDSRTDYYRNRRNNRIFSTPSFATPEKKENDTDNDDYNKPTLPQVPQSPDELCSDEKQLFEMLNQSRIENSVDPLEIDIELVELAREKALDMVENNYFDHYSPTYGSPRNLLLSHGYRFTGVAENIAKVGSAYRAHHMLLNSYGHRRNMLGSKFNRVGIGVEKLRNQPGIIVVQLFVY